MDSIMKSFGVIGETRNLFSPLVKTQYAKTPASTPPTTSSDKEMIKSLQKFEQMNAGEVTKQRV